MKKFVISILAILGMVGLVVAQPALAADSICEDDMSGSGLSADQIKQLKDAAGCYTNTRVEPVINSVLKVVIGIVGVLAVGVMIFGGIMYVTSTGDAQKAYKAKNVIIYGIVGLVVAMLAFAIVSFVSQSVSS